MISDEYSKKLQEGISYYKNNNYDSAISVLIDANSINPNDSRCLYWLGQAKHALFELDESIQCFNKAIKLNNEQPMYYVGLANLYLANDEIGKAKKITQLGLKHSPNNGELHNLMGSINLENGDRTKALKSFRNAYKLMPSLDEAIINYSKIKFEDGDKIYAIDNLSKVKKPTAKILAVKGMMQYELNDFVGALLSFEQSLAMNTKQASVCEKLGSIYMQAQQEEKACEMFHSAVSINPELAIPYHNLAIISLQNKDYQNAINYFNKAISIDSKQSEFYNNIGVAYWSIDSKTQAIKSFQQAISLDNKYEQAYINLCMLLHSMEKSAMSLKLFEEFKLLVDPSLFFYIEIIKIQIENNCLTEALVLINQAETILPEPHGVIELLELKMQTYWLMGEFSSCENVVNKLLELMPDSKSYHLALASLYLLKCQWRKGFKEYLWRLPEDIKTKQYQDKVPIWQGEDLDSKSILLWSEASTPETVLFLSLLGDISKDASRIILLCDQELSGLFLTSFNNITVITSNNNINKIKLDYHLPLGNLPLFYRKNNNDFSKQPTKYFSIDFKLKNEHKQIYQKKSNLPIIGVHTAYNTKHNNWIKIFNKETLSIEANYVVFARDSEINKNNFNTSLDSFTELSVEQIVAKLSALDYIVTDDSFIAMLANAAGTTCVFIAQKSPDWWWTQENKSSPWFPNVIIIRSKNNDIKLDLTNIIRYG